jgi:hypothetical protein
MKGRTLAALQKVGRSTFAAIAHEINAKYEGEGSLADRAFFAHTS